MGYCYREVGEHNLANSHTVKMGGRLSGACAHISLDVVSAFSLRGLLGPQPLDGGRTWLSASLPGGVFMLWTEAGAESQAFSPRRGIWFLGWPSL